MMVKVWILALLSLQHAQKGAAQSADEEASPADEEQFSLSEEQTEASPGDVSEESEANVSSLALPARPSHGTTIVSLHDGYCLAVDPSTREVVACRCTGARNQEWRLEGDLLKSVQDGLCLDNAVHDHGNHLVGWRCHGDRNQRWYVQGRSVRSKYDGRCLVREGNYVSMGRCNSVSRRQQWEIRGAHPPTDQNCCSKCSRFGKAFCSPRSGRCYDWQVEPHYQSCSTRPPVTRPPVDQNCCSKCSRFGKAFCSPSSGRCYDYQARPHYQSCSTRPPVRQGCCSKCALFGKAFCSPHSGRCYDWQSKPYYQSCSTRPPVDQNCCSKCSRYGKAFCSPRSGRCYDWQAKPHYQSCSTRPPVDQNCCSQCSRFGKAFCSPHSGRCYDWQEQGAVSCQWTGHGAPKTEAETLHASSIDEIGGADVQSNVFYP